MAAELRDLVASKLMLDWLPEHITGWLKTQYPNDGSISVPTRHRPVRHLQ